MNENELPFKRRKLMGAAQKPFKSPIRPALRSDANAAIKSTVATQLPLQQYIVAQTDPKVQSNSDNNGRTKNSGNDEQYATPSRATRTSKSSQHGQSSAIRGYETKIRAVTREIDQLKQAINILKSNKDEELHDLIEKWRAAARLAADEVYGVTRDKVNRMGGMEGLREQRRQTQELRKQWEDEDRQFEIEKSIKEFASRVDDGEATQEDLERFTIQVRSQITTENYDDEEGLDERETNSGHIKDEEDYTMGSMLREMKINFEVIGYCPRRQCWE